MYDLIVIGAGVAGLSAGMYAGRLEMDTLIIGKEIGGTVTLTGYIDNWPGFGKIKTMDLINRLEDHTKEYGIEIAEKEVQDVRIEGNHFTVVSGDEFYTRTIIFATGTERRRLKVKGSEKFESKGIHYCALCDGPEYKNKTVAVVGGGDGAVIEAITLSKYAKKVYLISRSEELHGEPTNMKKLREIENVEHLGGYSIIAVEGDRWVNTLKIEKNGERKALNVDGIFVSIGGVPNSSLAKKIGVKVNEKGEIIVNEKMETNIPGAFAAGDVVAMEFKQAITASAQGVIASYSAYRYLNRTPVYTCIVKEFAEPLQAFAENVLNDIGNALILDVRDISEYDRGHIPTAIHVEIKELENLKELFGKYEKIYVYSEDINCPASTIAARKLIELGYCNVYDFKGSFDEWVRKGYRVE